MAKIYQAALGILARREHAQRELKEKLTRRFGPAAHDDIQSVLQTLLEENLLSDERYAEMRVRSRISRGYGPGYIRQDLTAKGVGKELIENALEQAAINWLNHAEDLLARRHRDYQQTPQAWQKAARYLQRRGFPSDIVRRAVGDQPYA